MSAATITKRADELKPGDFLPANEAWMRRVILSVGPSTYQSGFLAIRWGGLDSGAVDTMAYEPHKVFAVEAPALSPAQQHAEELHYYAKELHSILYGEQVGRGPHHRENLEEVLAKIDPPQAPTYEEALDLLAKIEADQWEAAGGRAAIMAKVRDALDRARRSGKLKPEPGGYREGAQRVIDALGGKLKP